MPRDFQINKSNIRKSRFVDTSSADLTPNQIRVRVDKVAFTANNVTYAVSGDYLKYWNFFPSGKEGWGKLPVWGFGDVIESRHEGVAVGERLYGYFPLGSELVISADKVTPYTFIDAAPHRAELSGIYNTYTRLANTPGYDREELNALMRPMFTTSFLVDDFMADNDLFGATQFVLSSASSKTGYGTAFLLDANREQRGDYRVIGLTSAKNVEFVESLGCYDQVLAYEDVEEIDATVPTVYIDFSGSGKLRHTLHDMLDNKLRYDCAVGLTDWKRRGSAKGVRGVKPEFFFAPTQAQKRVKEWGGREFQRRLAGALNAFLDFSAENTQVTTYSTEAEMQQTYEAMVNNEASPERGFIFLLNPSLS